MTGSVLTNAVNAGGKITLQFGAGSSSDYVRLVNTTLVANVATVTLTNIAQTYSSIRLIAHLKGTSANAVETLSVTVNGDTSAIYDIQELKGTASTASSTESFAQAAFNNNSISCGGGLAGVFTSVDVLFSDYRNTAFNRDSLWRVARKDSTSTGGLIYKESAGYYRSVNAITSLEFSLSGGNFTNGCVFSVYGIN